MNTTARDAQDAVDQTEQRSWSDTLLTAEEVAALLQVTCSWVYAETRRHRIPHLRLGRYVRYRRGALESWMEDIERCPAGNGSSRAG